MSTVTFEAIWEKEFLPELTEKRRLECERQTEAFLDVTLTLCGETVRQMTPHDMLHLDALGNPFIAGSPDGRIELLDLAGFIWQLAAENNHTPSILNLWRRHHMVRRLAALDLPAAATEIGAFVDRMLLDGSEKPEAAAPPPRMDPFAPEPKTHFLTPLLVNLAGDIGHIDPMSGELLAHTPLPRLIQYSRAVDAKKGGPKTYGEIDSLRNRCMERVNTLNAAARSHERERVDLA